MRRILALILVAIVATSVYGAAATLGVEARPLGAGSAPVGDCHTGGGPTVVYDYTDNEIVSLTVTGLAPTCDGGTLQATLTKTDSTSIPGDGPVTVSGGAATITFASPIPGDQVAGYDIAIVTAP